MAGGEGWSVVIDIVRPDEQLSTLTHVICEKCVVFHVVREGNYSVQSVQYGVMLDKLVLA